MKRSARLVTLFWLIFATHPAVAETLTSASYQHVHGAPVAIAANTDTALTSTAPAPTIGSLEFSLGEAPSVAPSGSASDLTSVFPGFWSAFLGTQGGSPNLDMDGDGIAWFLDPDDDGDGLADVVETATGVFVSALDTGTNPFSTDTDGDGRADLVEILAGTDPNDPLSKPPPAVPLGGTMLPLAILAALLLLAVRELGVRTPRRLS